MRDRGLKKWHGFFMPEHISMLKKREIEDMKLEKPILDEDQVLEINDILVESIMEGKQILLKLWLDGVIEEFGPFTPTRIDPYQRKLYGLYKESNHFISFDTIVGANRV